jgi:hypothetical protein
MSTKLIFVAAIMIALTASAFADVKIKSKQTMSGQTYENTTYINGKRQRSEMMVNITQCDLRELSRRRSNRRCRSFGRSGPEAASEKDVVRLGAGSRRRVGQSVSSVLGPRRVKLQLHHF